MKQFPKFYFARSLIIIIGFPVYPNNKIEIAVGTLTPFTVALIETYLLLKTSQINALSTTRILMIGFVFEDDIFCPLFISPYSLLCF
ncbi:MAG: hypothetical protein Ct9H90mP20_3570 [Candidatus Neomarinimicrobiota bacterium]|nr:MAG: hypothetical protein Ct9H90mP20_3570 [Candidatus Neomarinimicrobiota bacterium]